jgi:hypothetical protein
MTWNYRLLERNLIEPLFHGGSDTVSTVEIVEVYHNEKGEPISWCKANLPVWDVWKDEEEPKYLKSFEKEIELIREAFELPILTEEDFD